MTINNEELIYYVEKVKVGEVDYLEKIYENYDSIIKSLARKYCIPGEDKEDIIQYLRIGLYNSIKNFKSEKSNNPTAFFIMCMKRYLKEVIKSSNRDKRKASLNCFSLDAPVPDLENKNIFFGDILSDEFLVEEYIEFKEFKNYIENEIILNLGKMSREVFLLYLKGFSYSEIAKMLDINVKQVDNAMQRARKTFKKIL